MIRFSLFGIPVAIEPFFWITLVILGGAAGADNAAAILDIGLFVIAGFISILVHELGHALTARSFGAHSRITLQAFGGYAAYTGVRLSRWQSFLVTAAGPGVQILLGLAVYFLARHLPNISEQGATFLSTLVLISFFWAILNLLPVLPLDGGVDDLRGRSEFLQQPYNARRTRARRVVQAKHGNLLKRPRL